MQGASRRSLTTLEEALDLTRGTDGGDLRAVFEDLLPVVGLLTREVRLRKALADPGSEPAQRVQVVDQLLTGQIRDAARAVVRGAVALRWSRSRDLLDALESLAAMAAFTVAEDEGTLDAVEDELFRFDRAVAGSPELRTFLTDPGVAAERRRGVVEDLTADAQPITRALLGHLVTYPRGERIEDALQALSTGAAQRRNRVVAEVRTAVALTGAQHGRLSAALTRIYGREVQLHVVVDATVVGGVRVTVGDEVIDGTVAHRLEQARRQVAG